MFTLEFFSAEADTAGSHLQIAALNSILENFQGGLQMYLKRTLHGCFTGKLPKFLLHFFLRTNFIKTTRLKLATK